MDPDLAATPEMSQTCFGCYMPSEFAFLDLINTEHIHDAKRVTDHLDDPARLQHLAERWGRVDQVGSRDEAELRDLRGVLRVSVENLMRNGIIGEEPLAALNDTLGAGTRTSRLTCVDGEFDLREQWNSPVSHVAWTFARYLATHDPLRLKLCANAHCRWAFHDQSKNRSRRWCSSQACGNVARLRAFRARAKQP